MAGTCEIKKKGGTVKPAVFVDRDGTINEQMGYVNHISRFVLLPGASEAIKLLNDNGYLVIVVTNQSGVARGYFPIELVYNIHRHMGDLLKKNGARVDGIFFCPHYPSGKVKEYAKICNCRKPNTGLIEMARDRFSIDMKNSWVVGDTISDIEMGKRAELKSILVETGYGMGEIEYVLPSSRVKPDHISDNLYEAVRFILSQRGNGS